jgi:hypothetical protein
LLPVPYYHLVFTLPHELNALAQHKPRELYTMLFAAASQTLIEFGRNPRWLGGEIAASLVLHTWGQTLTQHLHVHALVAAGALSADGAWIRSRRGFLFPVKALSIVFRGKFLAALARALGHGRLALSAGTAALGQARVQRSLLAALRAKAWVVYAKRPFAGPKQVLEYLGRYTHRTAISNERLVSLDADSVRFRYKDTAHGGRRRVMELCALEFLRRFALHVLPRGFNRIRHYGLLANRNKRALLAVARAALAPARRARPAPDPSPSPSAHRRPRHQPLHTAARHAAARHFARNRARRRDRELVPVSTARSASRCLRSCPARVDPVRPLCHSAPIAIRVPQRSAHRSCTPRRALRRTPRGIPSPSPSALALNPAVQSN